MLLLRTSLATLVVVAMAGFAYGQKACAPPACGPCGGCQKECGKGGKGSAKGCGLKTCCGEKQGCIVDHTTVQIEEPCFQCECTTVCLPAPACDSGCGKGCDKDCGACDPCAVKDCQTCGPKDGGKGGCGKGGGCEKLFPDLISSWTCKARVKKHLLMKDVVVCEIPCVTCNVDGKGGKGGKDCGCGGKGKEGRHDAAVPVPEVPLPEPKDPQEPEEIEGGGGVELDPESDVPEPPPISLGRRLRRAVPTPARRTTRAGLFDLLLR